MDSGNSRDVRPAPPLPTAGTGRPRGDTAGRILAAARQIIADEGADALRLATIAAALRISTPALYAHFPGGRTELIDRIAAEGVRGMAGLFPLTGKGARVDLFRGLSGLVRFFAGDRAFLRIMLIDFSSPKGHASISREIGGPRGNMANGMFQPLFERLDLILEGCVLPDRATPVPSRIFLNIVVGAVALNLVYPPDPGAASDDMLAAVEAIISDLVRRYLGIAPDDMNH